MLRRRDLLIALALLGAGCNKDYPNPFGGASQSQPPSSEAVLLFVSGSWAADPGQPRELLATNIDGSKVERLTSCTQNAAQPCDMLAVAPSANHNRVAVVRTTPDAQAGVAALYFMDLSRSLESQVVPRRQMQAVDWAPDDSFLVYSAVADNSTLEDLYYVLPDGTQDQDLMTPTGATTVGTPTVRERSPRIDPGSQTAVYERIDETGKAAIYLYPVTPVTSGGPGSDPLPGTPYIVGSDADPAISPDATSVAFRRLTSPGNGGLGTWDLMTLKLDGTEPTVVASGPLFRGAPDWGPNGIVFVETDAAASESRLVVLQPDGTGRTVLRTENAAFRMASPRWLR
jgi:Tol biopolymer transport system component